jgi:hypothetical protein
MPTFRKVAGPCFWMYQALGPSWHSGHRTPSGPVNCSSVNFEACLMLLAAGVSSDIVIRFVRSSPFTSLTLYYRYIAPGLPGDTIKIVSKTLRQGKETALAESRFYNSKGQLLCLGYHQKVS